MSVTAAAENERLLNETWAALFQICAPNWMIFLPSGKVPYPPTHIFRDTAGVPQDPTVARFAECYAALTTREDVDPALRADVLYLLHKAMIDPNSGDSLLEPGEDVPYVNGSLCAGDYGLYKCEDYVNTGGPLQLRSS